MTNINLTEKEIAVLTAYSGIFDYETADEQKADNALASDVEELSRIAEMPQKSVRSIVGSLTKKGVFCETMIGETGETKAIGITDEGIAIAYELNAKGDEPAPRADGWGEPDVEAIKSSLSDALGAEGATKCSALRAVAASCSAPRAAFIKAAEAVGINRGTAARQWQEGRADAPAAISVEECQALASWLADQYGADELAAKWIGDMPRATLAAYLKEMSGE